MSGAAYLNDPSFHESHRGPIYVADNGSSHGRDPSHEQIMRMAEAIRTACPRPSVWESRRRLEIPVLAEADLHLARK